MFYLMVDSCYDISLQGMKGRDKLLSMQPQAEFNHLHSALKRNVKRLIMH